MNTILDKNIDLLAASTLFFVQTFGITSDDFIVTLGGVTMSVLTKYYADRGVDFDINETPISTDAMMAVGERIFSIAQAAMLATACGITKDGLKGE